MNPLGLPVVEFLGALAGGFLAGVVVRPRWMRRMAAEAARASVAEHEQSCPGRTLLQPVGAEVRP